VLAEYPSERSVALPDADRRPGDLRLRVTDLLAGLRVTDLLAGLRVTDLLAGLRVTDLMAGLRD
jgi:hypothetical protein